MRYISIEQYDGTVTAFTEHEDWQTPLDSSACWVWQDADSKQTAISQHHSKHDEWESDVNAGREEKEVY